MGSEVMLPQSGVPVPSLLKDADMPEEPPTLAGAVTDDPPQDPPADIWIICFDPTAAVQPVPVAVHTIDELRHALQHLAHTYDDNPRFIVRVVRGELWHISKGPVRYILPSDGSQVPIFPVSDGVIEPDISGRLTDAGD